MNVVGKEYIWEIFLAILEKERNEMMYRAYMADALRIITENTAKFANGKYIEARFVDLIENADKMKGKPEDNRTAEEIIEHIRAGLERLGE